MYISLQVNVENAGAVYIIVKNFSDFYHVPLKLIYKREGWKRLCVLASQIEDFPAENEKEVINRKKERKTKVSSMKERKTKRKNVKTKVKKCENPTDGIRIVPTFVA